MATFASTRRVLIGHDWQELAEWVRAIDDLADMTDDEIDRLARPAPDSLADAA
jgi:hypothetical protein